MKKDKKHITYGVLILIVLGAVFFFGKGSFVDIQDVSVGLKWKHQAQFAGMYVARDKNFYKNKGLNVDLREFNFDISQSEELLEGRIDFALMSAEEFLLLVDAGEKVTAVAAFYQTSPYSLVSLMETGIKSPSDFMDKTLGVKGGKIEEKLFYLLLLDKFGISAGDVKMENIGFEKREIDDLVDGDVDIVGLYRTDQLYFFEQENVAYEVIHPERFGVNINNDILVVRSGFIAENPDVVAGFVSSTILGWKYALNNRNEAIDITLKYVSDDSYKDRDYEMHILDSSADLIQIGGGLEIGHINPAHFERLYETMKTNNFLKTEFVVLDYFTNEFVQ